MLMLTFTYVVLGNMSNEHTLGLRTPPPAPGPNMLTNMEMEPFLKCLPAQARKAKGTPSTKLALGPRLSSNAPFIEKSSKTQRVIS